MRMPHRQRRHARLPCGIQRHGQTISESGLRKAEMRIHMHHSATWGRDGWGHIPFHAPRTQLLAVAFDIIEPADLVPDRFGRRHGARHFRSRERLGPMRQERGLDRIADVFERDLNHACLPCAFALARRSV